MIIELQRAWTPKEMRAGECGVCGQEVAPAAVITLAATDLLVEMGQACPECIAYLGRRSPEKCPTIEFYEEALRKYPHPMFASEEDLEAAAREAGVSDPWDLVDGPSWLWTAKREEVER